MRYIARLLLRVFGAIMTGTATIFGIRPDPSIHWSIPPTMHVREDDGQAVQST